MVRETSPTRSGYSYEDVLLPALIPANASSACVHDRRLRRVLAAAGLELRDEGADLELGDAERVTGEAPIVIVPLSARSELPLGDLARRGIASVQCLILTLRAYWRLRALGYARLRVVKWQLSREMLADPLRSGSLRPAPRAFVVASKNEPRASVLDEVLAQARRRSGLRLTPGRVVPGHSLVVCCDDGILRLLLKPAAQVLVRSHAVLERIEREAPEGLRAIAPRALACEELGSVRWSLEERLSGTRAPTPLRNTLLEQAIGAIEMISQFGLSREGELDFQSPAEAIATDVPQVAESVYRLARTLELRLAGLPSVAAHGDFWSGNLLVRGEQLVGVVDWDGFADASPPLFDAIHFYLNRRPVPPHRWGDAFVKRVLPWARAGGDAVSRRLCASLDLSPSPELLELLAWAYWLRRASTMLEAPCDRRDDMRWVDRCIRHVLVAWEPSLTSRSRALSA